MPASKSNPLFTRTEKMHGRTRRKAWRRHHAPKHQIKGFARSKLGSLLGIPLNRDLLTGKSRSSRQSTDREPTASTSSARSVRGDVIEALKGQGYSAATAKRMAASVKPGDPFDAAFRRVMKRNPGELIIFGNPAKAYRVRNVKAAARRGNIAIPAAIIQGLGFGAGEQVAGAALAKKRKNQRTRRNPDSIGHAQQLFETFHHRKDSGVFDSHRSAKLRKDFTSLGPLVAIGVNAEQYDRIKKSLGRDWEDYKVEHWDKLPHLAFLTGSQVEHLKRVLESPDRYVQDCPQLASSPNGKQLYAITPDGADIDLRQFSTDTSKDFIDLGEATFVVYIAKKPDVAVEWVHELGEEGGVRPRLALNRLGKKELFFVGGSYTVQGPGILN